MTGEYRKGGTGVDPAAHRARIRRWVKDGQGAMSPDDIRARQRQPTPEHELARTEFALATWLWRERRFEAAEPHFLRAGELAPEDWTITRGSLPFRRLSSAGPEWQEAVRRRREQGHYYYEILADDPVPEDADRS